MLLWIASVFKRTIGGTLCAMRHKWMIRSLNRLGHLVFSKFLERISWAKNDRFDRINERPLPPPNGISHLSPLHTNKNAHRSVSAIQQISEKSTRKRWLVKENRTVAEKRARLRRNKKMISNLNKVPSYAAAKLSSTRNSAKKFFDPDRPKVRTRSVGKKSQITAKITLWSRRKPITRSNSIAR